MHIQNQIWGVKSRGQNHACATRLSFAYCYFDSRVTSRTKSTWDSIVRAGIKTGKNCPNLCKQLQNWPVWEEQAYIKCQYAGWMFVPYGWLKCNNCTIAVPSHVFPWFSHLHSQENDSPSLIQIPPFLQGDESHGCGFSSKKSIETKHVFVFGKICARSSKRCSVRYFMYMWPCKLTHTCVSQVDKILQIQF